MFALLQVAFLANVAIAVVSVQGRTPLNASSTFFDKRLSSLCDSSVQQSCSLDDPPENSCCYESPGGLILQTQFWDTDPSTGPTDSWMVHGLWPDNCDGTFTSNCDPSRDYTDIAGVLRSLPLRCSFTDAIVSNQGATDTLSYMEEYWVDINGQNERFWEHEWATHGTCYSTLQPFCLPSNSPQGAEAVAYFQQVVALFQKLPTYDWFQSQGIAPSSSQTYTLDQLTSALKAASGYTPAISCKGSAINQISWYFYIRGSVLNGNWESIDAPISSSCASSGLQYPPK
ncbi:ribonuclease T2 [Russula dissimulans]|nr:ribonuclease T2 [Russula dissimulans]